eukprot:SAG22_NODE_311_length_12629_cov_20.911891_6_plen_432_part_00
MVADGQQQQQDGGPPAHQKLMRAKNTAVRALMLCCLCRNFGIMVRMQTETQMWLNAFAGDYAGQARFQGNMESIAGILGFAITPVLAGLSDAVGRRPLMIMSPCFSVLTNIMIVARPTVGVLAVRRMLMPFSSTPWHSGEAAALADLFKGKPAEYGLAKSRIELVQSCCMIVCPLIGARLAQISLRLPWAVCGVSFTIMAVVASLFLQETLAVEERVPFRWKGSNPLSFMMLFRRGSKLRLLALAQIWNTVSGRFSTYRYEELHMQQTLQWGLAERGRYSSYRGMLSVPGSWISGTLMRVLGPTASLFIGQCSVMAEQLCASMANQGWHFYAIRTLRMTSAVSEVAMEYTKTSVGVLCGIPQGQLQGCLSNLRTICNILTPMLWGRIYAYGVRKGRPSLFYLVSAAAGVIQLLILKLLLSAPAPPPLEKKG